MITTSAPKRAAIYIRQSQTSDGTISPALQEQHVREFIARQDGWTITEVYSDIDISGRKTSNRPGLLALVADYNKKKFDIAVADDYSRFSRDMSDGADLIGSMSVATYAEGVPDPDDDFAPLLYMLLAHKYSKEMGKRWRAAHAYRLAAKLPPNGVRQFGYDRFDKDGKPVLPTTKGSVQEYRINEDEAAILYDLYKRYIGGEGSISLVQDLTKRGVKTVRGGDFSSSQLLDLLDKPFAAGYFIWDGHEWEGKHKPILTATEWTHYKDARAKRKVHQAPRNPKWWLAGIGKCGRCGANLVSTTIKGKQSVNCSVYNNKGKAACAGVFRKRATVDYHTMMWLFRQRAALAAVMPTDDEARLGAEKAVDEAQEQVGASRKALTELLLTMTTHGLSEEMAADAIAIRKSELADASEGLRQAQLALGGFIPATTISEQLDKGFELMGMKPEDEELSEQALPAFREAVSKLLKEVRILPPVDGNRSPNRDMRPEIVFVPQ
ncbi:recombinase family protein [Arthrobacter sp. Hz1]